MITLYGWGPLFDCPSPSPYVMKSEIQLQMLGLEFNRAIASTRHRMSWMMTS